MLTLEPGFLPTESTSWGEKSKEIVLILTVILFSNTEKSQGSSSSYLQNTTKTGGPTRAYTEVHELYGNNSQSPPIPKTSRYTTGCFSIYCLSHFLSSFPALPSLPSFFPPSFPGVGISWSWERFNHCIFGLLVPSSKVLSTQLENSTENEAVW